MSDPNAPVCLIEPVISDQQPDEAKFPPIPQAVDLASAMRAINTLSGIVRTIIGQVGPSSNTGGSGSGGSGGGGSKKKPAPQGRWIQKSITRKDVKVTNPDDPSQFVIVSRVENLTMRDTVTGEAWTWQNTNG